MPSHPRVDLKGDKAKAAGLIPVARVLLSELVNRLTKGGGVQQQGIVRRLIPGMGMITVRSAFGQHAILIEGGGGGGSSQPESADIGLDIYGWDNDSIYRWDPVTGRWRKHADWGVQCFEGVQGLGDGKTAVAVGYKDGSDEHALFATYDKGKTWQEILTPPRGFVSGYLNGRNSNVTGMTGIGEIAIHVQRELDDGSMGDTVWAGSVQGGGAGLSERDGTVPARVGWGPGISPPIIYTGGGGLLSLVKGGGRSVRLVYDNHFSLFKNKDIVAPDPYAILYLYPMRTRAERLLHPNPQDDFKRVVVEEYYREWGGPFPEWIIGHSIELGEGQQWLFERKFNGTGYDYKFINDSAWSADAHSFVENTDWSIEFQYSYVSSPTSTLSAVMFSRLTDEMTFDVHPKEDDEDYEHMKPSDPETNGIFSPSWVLRAEHTWRDDFVGTELSEIINGKYEDQCLVIGSDDKGYSWSLKSKIPYSNVGDMVYLGSGVVLLIALNEIDAPTVILRSANYGASWDTRFSFAVDSGAGSYKNYAIVNVGGGVAVYIYPGYTLRTTNYGATWSESSNDFTVLETPLALGNGRLALMARTDDHGKGLFVSTGGLVWQFKGSTDWMSNLFHFERTPDLALPDLY